MMREKFTSERLSWLLKEKGLEGGDRYGFYCGGVFHRRGLYPNEPTVNAYTYGLVAEWLREKGFHTVPSISYDTSVDADGNEVERRTFWFFEIFNAETGDLIFTEEENEYGSCDEATEAMFTYCLKKLL